MPKLGFLTNGNGLGSTFYKKKSGYWPLSFSDGCALASGVIFTFHFCWRQLRWETLFRMPLKWWCGKEAQWGISWRNTAGTQEVHQYIFWVYERYAKWGKMNQLLLWKVFQVHGADWEQERKERKVPGGCWPPQWGRRYRHFAFRQSSSSSKGSPRKVTLSRQSQYWAQDILKNINLRTIWGACYLWHFWSDLCIDEIRNCTNAMVSFIVPVKKLSNPFKCGSAFVFAGFCCLICI